MGNKLAKEQQKEKEKEATKQIAKKLINTDSAKSIPPPKSMFILSNYLFSAMMHDLFISILLLVR